MAPDTQDERISNPIKNEKSNNSSDLPIWLCEVRETFLNHEDSSQDNIKRKEVSKLGHPPILEEEVCVQTAPVETYPNPRSVRCNREAKEGRSSLTRERRH